MSGIRLYSLQLGPAASEAWRIPAQPIGIEQIALNKICFGDDRVAMALVKIVVDNNPVTIVY